MRRVRPGLWLATLTGLFVAAMTVVAYTAAQADAGRQLLAGYCAGCHGPTLGGALGPGLVGAGFRATWNTAAALFTYVSQQMPLRAGGLLSPEQYWNLVAYLLRENGIAPDEAPLNEQTAGRVRLGQRAA